jgi:hypothetical protein
VGKGALGHRRQTHIQHLECLGSSHQAGTALSSLTGHWLALTLSPTRDHTALEQASKPNCVVTTGHDAPAQL